MKKLLAATFTAAALAIPFTAAPASASVCQCDGGVSYWCYSWQDGQWASNGTQWFICAYDPASPTGFGWYYL